MPIEHRIVLHRIVAKTWQLLILFFAVAAKNQRLARIVMPAFGRRDRKPFGRGLAGTYQSVRSGLGKKDDEKQRRQHASPCIFLDQCPNQEPHSNFKL